MKVRSAPARGGFFLNVRDSAHSIVQRTAAFCEGHQLYAHQERGDAMQTANN